jgi:uracil-DNA glycosylase family 4
MSLDLDKRQRAMLREMGVRVWQPLAPAVNMAQAETASPGPAAAAPAQSPEPRSAAQRPAPPRVPAAQPAPAVRAAPALPQDPGLQPRPAGIASMDWPALQAAVAGCRACALCQSRRSSVFGVGPLPPADAAPGAAPQVDWLIVGEAPGENEDLAGEPFVGQAGQLLDNMLQAMQLQRVSAGAAPRAGLSQSVYITNVLKCRPPANRNPEPAEVAQCAPYLKRQVELLQPKIILALGKFAAQSLLQDSVPEVHKIPLGKLRGQLHSYLGVPVVVTYHPAYLLRSLADKARAWDDLCLAMAQLQPQP